MPCRTLYHFSTRCLAIPKTRNGVRVRFLWEDAVKSRDDFMFGLRNSTIAVVVASFVAAFGLTDGVWSVSAIVSAIAGVAYFSEMKLIGKGNDYDVEVLSVVNKMLRSVGYTILAGFAVWGMLHKPKPCHPNCRWCKAQIAEESESRDPYNPQGRE